MAYEKEYEFAKKLAVEVGAYIAEQQEKKHTITEKGNKELCTETDIGSEKRIIAGIRSTFPDDTILAEESQNELHEETERLWIVDPIDGTHQFANGEDNYAILISFVVKGKAVVGVACQPNVKKLYHAKKGEGAWCNEREIRTTEEKDLKKLLVIKALWYDREENKLDEGLAVLKKMMENCLDERRYGSCGIDCTRVASGKAGAYYEFSLKPWDVAGPGLIAEEAGCTVSHINGDSLNILNKREGKWAVDLLVSANPTIHKKMLSILNE